MKISTLKEFITKNTKYKVTQGERLTPEGKTLYTKEDVDRSDRVKYIFEDGTSMTLMQDSIEGAMDFSPEWKFS